MTIMIAIILAWVLLRLVGGAAQPRSRSPPRRELYERRLREGRWR